MPTTRKSATARANGAKSRGPKTAATRAISALNNISHGLTAWSTLVLQCESQEEFDKVLAYYTQAFAPANDAELEFITEMVGARWRLRRICSIETALIDAEMDRQRPQIAREITRCDDGVKVALAFRALADESRALHLASRYESRLRRIFDRAFANLQTLQQARKAAEKKECDSNHQPINPIRLNHFQRPKTIPNQPQSQSEQKWGRPEACAGLPALLLTGPLSRPQPQTHPVPTLTPATSTPETGQEPTPC